MRVCVFYARTPVSTSARRKPVKGEKETLNESPSLSFSHVGAKAAAAPLAKERANERDLNIASVQLNEGRRADPRDRERRAFSFELREPLLRFYYWLLRSRYLCDAARYFPTQRVDFNRGRLIPGTVLSSLSLSRARYTNNASAARDLIRRVLRADKTRLFEERIICIVKICIPLRERVCN